MHADSSYVMGMGHRVCQDYARAGRTPQEHPLVYGIVSDGCSSSPDTDVGARLLALGAEAMLHQCFEQTLRDRHFYRRQRVDPEVPLFQEEDCLNRPFMDVARHAFMANHTLRDMQTRLRSEALDATLLFVAAESSGVARFCCMGDGVIAAKDWVKGGLRIWDVEAPDGYPRYPNYCNNDMRRASVEAGSPWIVRFPGGGEFHTSKVKSFDQPVVGAQVVAIFSDGVRSFTDAERNPIPSAEIVAELMAFKGYQGAFVQRRMHAFLKAAAKRGWRHEDDLAMAAIDMAVEGV